VREGVPPAATDLEVGAAGYEVRNSVMEAFTQHNPKPCLSDDDVEALATLYPDCSAVSLSTNVCHKVNLSIGLVRLFVYVLTPLLLALVFILLLSSWVHAYHKEELEQARRAAWDARSAGRGRGQKELQLMRIDEAALQQAPSRSPPRGAATPSQVAPGASHTRAP